MLALSFFANSFAQSLSLLGVHCLYRYTVITGRLTYFFTTTKGILCVVVTHFTASMFYVVFCVCGMQPTKSRTDFSRADMKKYLNVTLDESVFYFAPNYLVPDEAGREVINWVDLISSTMCLVLCGSIYSLICYTGVKLYFHVKSAVITGKQRRIQLQLLYVLLAQALSPVFFEFFPAFCIILGGFFHLVQQTKPGIYFSMFIAGYSAADAILVLILFKAYRVRVAAIVRKILPFFGKSESTYKINTTTSSSLKADSQNIPA
ncbi:unnamed protein product, partial [Mesorhabditis spiculigera]